MNLVCNDELSYNWLIKRISAVIQNPKLKIPTYIVFQGKGGSGKGTFVNLILRAIWEQYVLETDVTKITNNFNSQFYNKLWVVCDETQKEKNSKSSLDSTIKRVTGSEFMEIEKKGFDAKEVKAFCNYIFCSNKTDLDLKLDVWDRRASVFGFSDTLGGSKEKSSQLYSKYVQEIPKEISNFLSYLRTLDFDLKEVMVSIHTEARQNLINIGMNNFDLFDQWVNTLFNSSKISELKDDSLETSQFRKYFSMLMISNKEGWFLSSGAFYSIYLTYCKQNNLNPVREKTFFADLYNKTSIFKELNSNNNEKVVNINGYKFRVFNKNSFLNYYNISNDIDYQSLNLSNIYKKLPKNQVSKEVLQNE